MKKYIEILKPIIATVELPKSAKLFKASEIIDIDEKINPTTNFKITKIALVTIPKKEPTIP